MAENEIKILFTGDLAAVGSAESLPGKPYSLVISDGIKELFREHDLRVVNLESPLTTSTDKILKSGPHLKGHPESIRLLKDLGVDVACLSNNHIRDFGDRGVVETITTCNEHGIRTVGAGKDSRQAAQPLFIDLNGSKIAILNFSETEFNAAGEKTAGSNPDDPMHIWNSVREAKIQSDILIVVLHGGREMYPLPTPNQQKLFRFIADAGADAVIGHHSHVTGGYEYYHDIPLVYSLGNFIFDEEGNPPEWFEGALAGVEIKPGRPAGIRFFRVALKDGKLTSDSPDQEKNDFMKKVSEEEVRVEWEKLVASQSEKIIKGLVASNRIISLLLKLKIISLQDHQNYLVPLLNRFRCRTHREITIDSINHFINTNRDK